MLWSPNQDQMNINECFTGYYSIMSYELSGTVLKHHKWEKCVTEIEIDDERVITFNSFCTQKYKVFTCNRTFCIQYKFVRICIMNIRYHFWWHQVLKIPVQCNAVNIISSSFIVQYLEEDFYNCIISFVWNCTLQQCMVTAIRQHILLSLEHEYVFLSNLKWLVCNSNR